MDRVNLTSRHQLRLFYRALDGVNRGFDVDDDPFLHPAGRMRADANDFHFTVSVDLPYHCDDLRGPDIEPDNHLLADRVAH